MQTSSTASRLRGLVPPGLVTVLVFVAHTFGAEPLTGGDSRPLMRSLDEGAWVLPPHELIRLPLQLGTRLGSGLGLERATAATVVCSAALALGAGCLTLTLQRRGRGAVLAVLGALLWASASTPWRAGTTLEYPAIPGALTLLAIALLHAPPTRLRAVGVGLVAGLLPLVHLLFLAAVPALLAGVPAPRQQGRWQHTGVALGVAATVLFGGHALVKALAPGPMARLSWFFPLALTELPLQQARVPLPPGAPVFAEWLHGLGRAWYGGPTWLAQAVALASVGVVLLGLAHRVWKRRPDPAGLALPLLALGLWAAGAYIEPINYEYHLVPMAVVLLLLSRPGCR